MRINQLIKNEENFNILNIKRGLEDDKNRIYRGIVSYLYDTAEQQHIESVTPWDVISILTDDKGQSLIQLVQFPSKMLSVTFTVNGTSIPNVYDVTLNQFMGMVLASAILVKYQILSTIFGIQTQMSSFKERIRTYDVNHKRSLYILRVIGKIYGVDVFSFDDIDFISGFITPFSWVGEDHHKYWTEFKQINNPQALTF